MLRKAHDKLPIDAVHTVVPFFTRCSDSPNCISMPDAASINSFLNSKRVSARLAIIFIGSSEDNAKMRLRNSVELPPERQKQVDIHVFKGKDMFYPRETIFPKIS